MRELFRSEEVSAVIGAPRIPEDKTKVEDYSDEYVASQEITIENAIARQAGILEAAEKKGVSFFETGRSVSGALNNGTTFHERRFKNRVEKLKNLSESSIPSRAINIIRGGIGNLEYAVRPKDPNLRPSEISTFEESIKKVRNVIDNPNATDDDLNSFLGQIVEDIQVFDAGCWEYVEKPEFTNPFLALEVVPGYTISQALDWKGDPDAIRWAQVVNGQAKVFFKDKELEYLMSRKRSWSPFGYSNLESAMEILEAFFSVSAFQRATASEAFPPFLVWLGENIGDGEMRQMRAFWDMELKGRGTPAFWANTGKPEVISLKPHTDDGLFLRYTELLIRVLAFCFNLKPQDFGIERDVNRSTAQVAQSASVEEAIKPIASMIAAKFNTKVLPRIAEMSDDKKILELEFFWGNIDPRDDKQESEIVRGYTQDDLMKMDEARARMDLPPLPNGVGQLTITAYRILVKFNPELAVDDATRDLLFPEQEEAEAAVLEELREDAALSEEEKALKDITEQLLVQNEPDAPTGASSGAGDTS